MLRYMRETFCKKFCFGSMLLKIFINCNATKWKFLAYFNQLLGFYLKQTWIKVFFLNIHFLLHTTNLYILYSYILPWIFSFYLKSSLAFLQLITSEYKRVWKTWQTCKGTNFVKINAKDHTCFSSCLQKYCFNIMTWITLLLFYRYQYSKTNYVW